MARRSRVHGVSKLRRKLRRFPDDAQREAKGAVENFANAVHFTALGLVPVDEGELRYSIDVKISRDGLTALVGPGASAAESVRRRAGSAFNTTKFNLREATKFELFQFFKGYWIEFGTKGSPENGIPAQPARPFMTPAFKTNERAGIAMIANGVNKALDKAARG